MPSTYTSNNKIQKIATGEQSGTWGNTTNTNFDLFDTAIDGFVAVALTGTTHTLNIPDGTAADGRNKVISFTGALAAANTVSITPNTVKKHYFVQNNTTGGQNVIISQGSGSTVTIKPGYSSIVYLNGAGSGQRQHDVAGECYGLRYPYSSRRNRHACRQGYDRYVYEQDIRYCGYGECSSD